MNKTGNTWALSEDLFPESRNKEISSPLLQHALVLPSLKPKGLEFDAVILFNFFSDSSYDVQGVF